MGFRATYAPIKTTILFREGVAYFSKPMLKHMLHLLQQHGFGAGLACHSPGFLELEHHKKAKYNKRRPRMAARILYRQEWGNLPFP